MTDPSEQTQRLPSAGWWSAWLRDPNAYVGMADRYAIASALDAALERERKLRDAVVVARQYVRGDVGLGALRQAVDEALPIALIGTERPPDVVFNEFRRLHDLPAGCQSCDGTGCPCMRTRDWQSMEQGCECGCSECGFKPSPTSEEATG